MGKPKGYDHLANMRREGQALFSIRETQLGHRQQKGKTMSTEKLKDDEFDGVTTKYQLNLIYLLDTSGSMSGEPINQLNRAMAEAVQIAEEAARENEIQLIMRVVQFNSVAKWLIGDMRKGVEHIDWAPLDANGGTDTAGAIELARSVMQRPFAESLRK